MYTFAVFMRKKNPRFGFKSREVDRKLCPWLGGYTGRMNIAAAMEVQVLDGHFHRFATFNDFIENKNALISDGNRQTLRDDRHFIRWSNTGIELDLDRTQLFVTQVIHKRT